MTLGTKHSNQTLVKIKQEPHSIESLKMAQAVMSVTLSDINSSNQGLGLVLLF